MEGAVRIAITDDEAGMRNSLSFLLEQEGFSVVTFENGLQLLQAMSEIRFDLFLLDVCMPEMDGFQLLDRILESDAHAPVVMMTGQASIESAVRALKKGACDYLRKPFEHEDLVKTVRNVLGQKRLKDENKAISDRLAVSEKRYRYIVQNSPDIIYTLDPDGTCTFMNEAVERVLGYRPESLIGTRFEDLIHPDDVEKSRWLFEERRCDERAAAGIEIRLMCHGNPQNYRHCLIKQLTVPSASSENPAGKGKRCIYGVARDFSYRRLLEIQLREAQKMEAIGTLAGGIAHDFNNMLMCIQGYTSLMLSSLDPGNSFYDKLLNVEHNIQLGAELTGQLLGFARSGKYHVRPMDINELVKRTAEMFGRTKKEVIIHQRLRKDLWTALADEGQIEQVLLNLYVNAWQAMPGGGEIYLDTENEPLVGHGLEKIGLKPGNYIKISVTDTGAGMDEKIQKRIFEPFFTTKERGRGTGLGLASAYGILENHGGGIKVFSKKGEGSTFVIYLPMTDAVIEKRPERSGEIQTGDETVLLVDDEDNILQVTTEMLEQMGYEVLVARNGNEALEVIREDPRKVDLLILDMIMPGLSGGKTFDRVREICSDLKVLLSSGYSINGEAEEILQRGCDGFIQKPYTMGELSEKITRIMTATNHTN
jgi:two-component system, cell cycle sensor histidine kinase and response regulator CckA